MSYSEIQKKYQEDSLNRVVATKIIDLMRELRLNPNDATQRRWIWELMQNAKDVRHKNHKVSMEIDFIHNATDKVLNFSHNGKPFSMENITYLINQVSAKDRDTDVEANERTTGKFGTGFLTTHLLSERVEVESVIQEGNQPYKKFKLPLDRSGRKVEEIIKSVNESHDSIAKIDLEKSFEDYLPEEYNTTFSYNLNASGIEVAQKGLEDLHDSIIFTLVFLPEIETVYLSHDEVTYQLDSKVIKINDDIEVYSVKKITPQEVIESKVAVLTQGKTQIAMAIEYKNNRIYLKDFNPRTPRLFCDFPLVGTENFPFPAIINSPEFNSTEPRDFIYLQDSEAEEITENKALVKDARDLFLKLLNFASTENWGNIHLLATFPKLRDRDKLIGTWYSEEVEKPIKEKLLVTPIVDTEYGKRISILDKVGEPIALFPAASTKEIREKIWDVANYRFPENLPRKKDTEIWASFALPQNQLTLKFLAEDIQGQENITKLQSNLFYPGKSIEWLNLYYQIGCMEGRFIQAIEKDEFKIFPNQNGDFINKSMLELDLGIEEELKKIRAILGFNYKEFLLHKEVRTEGVRFQERSQKTIIEGINETLKENDTQEIDEALSHLLSLTSTDSKFPKSRMKIFNFYHAIYQPWTSELRGIDSWSEDIWLEADKKALKRITQKISECKNTQVLSDLLNMNVEEALNWLNSFIAFLVEYEFEYLLNLKQAPILPNQNGIFQFRDSMFLDGGIIEELKEISADLGTDFKEELLDSTIALPLPESRLRSQTDVALEITHLVNSVDKDSINPSTKKAFNKLLLWFSHNSEFAEKLFGDLYRHKHKLYDDEEIASNIEKAEEISGILKEFGIENLSSLREVIKENKNLTTISSPAEVTLDSIVDLGVSTIDEWEEAMKHDELSSRFFHESKPSKEMLEYVQRLLKRAKKNVFDYLNDLPEYDCTEWEEISSTVIGGVLKEGELISIVVRPSDNGSVIIYYGAEKDALDYGRSELWVEDGKANPIHLTLGKILKFTRINKIPVTY